MDDLLKILLGAIAVFISAALVEPVKIRINEREKKNRLLCELYREFCQNYIVISDIVAVQVPPESSAPGHVCRTKLSNDIYEEALKQPLAFRSFKEAHWFDAVYRDLANGSK